MHASSLLWEIREIFDSGIRKISITPIEGENWGYEVEKYKSKIAGKMVYGCVFACVCTFLLFFTFILCGCVSIFFLNINLFILIGG